jgi:Zn-dependent protease
MASHRQNGPAAYDQRVSQPSGVSLGRLFGVSVRLAPSWFVIAVVVVLLFAPQVASAGGPSGAGSYLVAMLYAVLLLVSVLVHEFAHALAARSVGLPVHEVVADLWGGHTAFEDPAPTPGRNAYVAVVGPLANAVLAGAGFWLLGGLDEGVVRLLVVALVFSNAFVALFNLAPGLPLDGGRVVESLVWAVTGRHWAGTLSAGWCGRAFAVLLLYWTLGRPLLAGQRPSPQDAIWGLMVAFLLWQGASSAVMAGRVRRQASGLRLRELVEPALVLPVSSTDWSREPFGQVVALDGAGRAVGVLTTREVHRMLFGPVSPPSGTPLSAVMTALPPEATLQVGASGQDVLRALTSTMTEVYVVVDAGRVIGLADAAALSSQFTRGL